PRNASPAAPSGASETLKGPRSNCIRTMRPIWGSSSMTSRWWDVPATSEESGDLGAVAGEVEQQGAHVGPGLGHDQELGVGREAGDDGQSGLELHDTDREI